MLTLLQILLYFTFLTHLPSEPSARVDGLAEIEAAVKPARIFAEALAFLHSWRQKIVTVVNDLSGNPEPLKLLGSLRSLISSETSLVSSNTAFATEVSQIYRQTNVKTVCNDASFWATVDLLEIELSTRAQEDKEEKRKQKSAGVAIAAFTSAQKGSGKTKSSQKPICRDFLTDSGCPRGGQCTFQHPQTVGRCLRCGSTKHAVADCKKPGKDATATSSSKGKGKGPKANPQPKASSSGTSTAKPAPKPKAGAQKRGQSQPKAKAKAKGSAHSAEIGNLEIDWARTALEDSNAATENFSV